MLTIHEHIANGRAQLRDAGISGTSAALEARLLAQFALGWSAERLLTSGHDVEPGDFASRYDALVRRRIRREPHAYIVGEQEFWGLPFEVSPAVLIPRPETELIVEATLERFPDSERPLNVADVCTGSGCIAVALAHERRLANITATDISASALVVATRNAERHGVGDRVRFQAADLLDGIDGTFDVIMCNPPYVCEGDRPGLQPEVRDHEPDVALYGGADGLGIIKRLVASAAPRLASGAYLIFEFGLGQDEQIESLIAESRTFVLEELRRDLQGIARTAVALRI